MAKEKEPIRGRGSSHNPANRFEPLHYATDDDDFDYAADAAAAGDEDDRPRVKTAFYRDASKSVLTYNTSPDVRFNVGLNPYRGCEHGCSYCYARPHHEYLGFSAGLDFETKIIVKENAPELLDRELRARKWKPQLIGLSGVTDPYQPVERRLGLTRRCLEVLAAFRNPVLTISKNHLITRDADVISSLAEHNATTAVLSISTLDTALARTMEPRTSSPQRRLDAIATLADAGIPTGVFVAPVVPGLTDHEIPAIIRAAADAGATWATYIVLRLPLAVAGLFEEWLDTHAAGHKEKVLNRMRAMRGGSLYKSEFGRRMTGSGPFADQIRSLFDAARVKAGLERRPPELSAAAFRIPPQGGQMTLFGS